jgi:hypothetical protein
MEQTNAGRSIYAAARSNPTQCRRARRDKPREAVCPCSPVSEARCRETPVSHGKIVTAFFLYPANGGRLTWIGALSTDLCDALNHFEMLSRNDDEIIENRTALAPLPYRIGLRPKSLLVDRAGMVPLFTGG